MCNRVNTIGSSKSAGVRALLAPIVLCVSVVQSGCAVNSGDMTKITSGDQLVTNSVAERAKPKGVSETDARIIRDSVAHAEASSSTLPLSWDNAETGSTGKIVSIDRFLGKHGQRCRGFKTSVENFKGIGFYNGETCQISEDKWVLSWFKSADSQ